MTETLHRITCHKCKTDYGISDTHYRAAAASSKISIFCTYGHEAILREGPSEADTLRLERDRLKQKIAQVEDEKRIAWATASRREEERAAAERRASAARGQVTKIKKRVAGGACPCCNRTFIDLQRHMTTKHKGFVAEPVDGDRPGPAEVG